jgi:hypothetical protein
VNEIQAAQALTALGSTWTHLRDLDAVGIELWYRNALRDTPFEATDDKPGALEVVDRLVSTCQFPPKPHDWIEAHRFLANEKRRARALDTRSITAPKSNMAQAAVRVGEIRERYFPKDPDA